MAKLALRILGVLLLLAVSYDFRPTPAAGQSSSLLVDMTDYPRQIYSAIAVDEAGGLYFGHLQRWTRVGTVPGRPVSIWSRPSDGSIFVALDNGDLYQVGSPGWAAGDFRLTFDSNVFGGATRSNAQSFGSLKARYR